MKNKNPNPRPARENDVQAAALEETAIDKVSDNDAADSDAAEWTPRKGTPKEEHVEQMFASLANGITALCDMAGVTTRGQWRSLMKRRGEKELVPEFLSHHRHVQYAAL